jgi:hypothetical protein
MCNMISVSNYGTEDNHELVANQEKQTEST